MIAKEAPRERGAAASGDFHAIRLDGRKINHRLAAAQYAIAEGFLDRLAPGGQLTFQTFDDGPAKRRALAVVLHGSFQRHARRLAGLNADGAGIFVTVNRTDGRGRKAHNILGVRALFIDLDGAPLAPVLNARLRPHIIVESSSGRFHVYWLAADCPLHRFGLLQRALARRFNGDPVVCDLPRVMRMPGFWHCKAEPFETRIVAVTADQPYSVADLVQAFDLHDPPPQPGAACHHEPIEAGSRYASAALNRAVMAVMRAPNGRQNFTLNREGFSLGQLVKAGLLDKARTHAALLKAGAGMTSHDRDRPWLADQIEAIVDRALADGAAQPRTRRSP